ncbi:MAG TPA: GntR family transcriptional regulator [Terriglobales bacterium]|nr:GntR family transcriptional regulator [Terriglobales bacterium]
MQLWFAHKSEVTIREQLVTQVVLGILSDDLAPGQRLPSTRELARRFQLHPNTVSAGYRQLERERWVEFRRGSGVYVRKQKPNVAPTSAITLDQLIANLFRSARNAGVPLSMVYSRLRHWMEMQPPNLDSRIESVINDFIDLPGEYRRTMSKARLCAVVKVTNRQLCAKFY